jgi:hypothetical protein
VLERKSGPIGAYKTPRMSDRHKNIKLIVEKNFSIAVVEFISTSYQIQHIQELLIKKICELQG